VIVFVTMTAVLNICLGYALAVYLGGARWPFGHRAAIGVSLAPDALVTESPREVAPPVAATPSPPAAPPPEPEPPAPPATTPVAVAVPAVDLEQDVLAGIEEFRNQLAQMKAQTGEPSELAPVR
jgi:hypothetical protein